MNLGKYIIIAFGIYVSAAFMNGIIRGAWESNSSSKSAQNVLSNAQYGSKFSVEGNGAENILANQQTEPFIPPPSAVEETGWRTMPIKSISNNNDKIMSNQQSASFFSQDENGETVALKRVYNRPSKGIKNILIDQQTEPFIPPPSAVEETGWRTMPIEANKASNSTENILIDQQTEPFIPPPSVVEETGWRTMPIEANEASNSIVNILVDQQTEPFIPPPSAVEETGWRTMPAQPNSDESISSEVKSTDSSGNDIEDLEEASQRNKEEEVQIRVVLKRQPKSKSDTHIDD